MLCFVLQLSSRSTPSTASNATGESISLRLFIHKTKKEQLVYSGENGHLPIRNLVKSSHQQSFSIH